MTYEEAFQCTLDHADKIGKQYHYKTIDALIVLGEGMALSDILTGIPPVVNSQNRLKTLEIKLNQLSLIQMEFDVMVLFYLQEWGMNQRRLEGCWLGDVLLDFS